MLSGWNALSFFVFIFFMWAILKVFIEFVNNIACFMFYFGFFQLQSILAPWPGIEPVPPALESWFWTTERRFPWVHFFVHHSSLSPLPIVFYPNVSFILSHIY